MIADPIVTRYFTVSGSELAGDVGPTELRNSGARGFARSIYRAVDWKDGDMSLFMQPLCYLTTSGLPHPPFEDFAEAVSPGLPGAMICVFTTCLVNHSVNARATNSGTLYE